MLFVIVDFFFTPFSAIIFFHPCLSCREALKIRSSSANVFIVNAHAFNAKMPSVNFTFNLIVGWYSVLLDLLSFKHQQHLHVRRRQSIILNSFDRYNMSVVADVITSEVIFFFHSLKISSFFQPHIKLLNYFRFSLFYFAIRTRIGQTHFLMMKKKSERNIS